MSLLLTQQLKESFKIYMKRSPRILAMVHLKIEIDTHDFFVLVLTK